MNVAQFISWNPFHPLMSNIAEESVPNGSIHAPSHVGRLPPQVRSIARQGTPLHPWIEPRESRWYKSGKSLFFESDLYQEMLLHMAMAGVRRYLWW